MPIRHQTTRRRSPTATELTRMLIAEWQKPKEDGQPLIVIEGREREPKHIYVIWDEWRELSQIERSEIIMDVIEHLSGSSAIDPMLVTVAMGLTADEAGRMGLEAA